jgi:phosphohistidine swiveling domain-containing protein
MVSKCKQFISSKGNSLGLLGQKAEFFVQPLESYKANFHSYKSEKINSLARLTSLGIPTVPFPHYLKQESYLFYLHTRRIHPKAYLDLKEVFQKIKASGYNLAVRPSIFDPNVVGFEFIVPNAINIPTFNKLIKAIKTGYNKIIVEAKRPEIVEFVYIVQGFYTSNRCGLAQTDDGTGKIHIEAAFGEHSMVITRGQVKPDIYKVDKNFGQIFIKEIAEKEFALEPSKSGLIKVPLASSERKRQVLHKDEIKTLAKYALKMEKEHGPQEIEWAVLRSGELIFQASRKANLQKLKKVPVKDYPIFPGNVKAEIVSLNKLGACRNLAKKIVITHNLAIDFITQLTCQNKPAGIILTHGSLTAHATTIIREAKIPSVLAPGFKAAGRFLELKEDGTIISSGRRKINSQKTKS